MSCVKARDWQAEPSCGVYSTCSSNLHLHLAIFVGGVFDEDIDAYQGISQGFYIDHFLNLERDSDSGDVLMPLFGPPVMAAASIPSDLMRYYRTRV